MTVLVAAVVGIIVGHQVGRLGRRFPESAAVRRIVLALGCAVGIASVLVPVLIVLDGSGRGFGPIRDADDPRLMTVLIAMHGSQLGAVACARAMGEDLGTRPTRHGFGLATLVGLGAIGVSAVWSLLLTALGFDFGNQAIVDAITGSPRLGMVLAVVVVAPILEELLFRGWVLPRLMRRFGDGPGFVITAVGFAAMHLDAPQVAPPILALALALGWLRVRTGSVWPGVVAHATNNAIALVLAGLI